MSLQLVRRIAVIVFVMLGVSASAGGKGKHAKPAKAADKPVVGDGRDWAKSPAIVELTTTEDIYALSDVHGASERMVTLLAAAGLITPSPDAEGGFGWSGGRAVLICIGDVIDKGDQSLAAIDVLRALEASAAAAGGHVIVTLGNHEAEFLDDPHNKKAKHELDKELTARKIDPDEVAAGRGPYGTWLYRRPLAAHINDWFFVHGGDSGGRSLGALSDAFRKAVDAKIWGADVLIGKGSILEAQKWWKEGALDTNLAGLGVKHIVFGHDPGAFDEPGRIAEKFDGKLFRVDVGMSPAVDLSHGALLLIHHTEKGGDQAYSIDVSGKRRPLWPAPPAQ